MAVKKKNTDILKLIRKTAAQTHKNRRKQNGGTKAGGKTPATKTKTRSGAGSAKQRGATANKTTKTTKAAKVYDKRTEQNRGTTLKKNNAVKSNASRIKSAGSEMTEQNRQTRRYEPKKSTISTPKPKQNKGNVKNNAEAVRGLNDASKELDKVKNEAKKYKTRNQADLLAAVNRYELRQNTPSNYGQVNKHIDEMNKAKNIKPFYTGQSPMPSLEAGNKQIKKNMADGIKAIQEKTKEIADPTQENWLRESTKELQGKKIGDNEKYDKATATSTLSDAYNLMKKKNPNMDDADIYGYLLRFSKEQGGSYGEEFEEQARAKYEKADQEREIRKYVEDFDGDVEKAVAALNYDLNNQEASEATQKARKGTESYLFDLANELEQSGNLEGADAVRMLSRKFQDGTPTTNYGGKVMQATSSGIGSGVAGIGTMASKAVAGTAVGDFVGIDENTQGQFEQAVRTYGQQQQTAKNGAGKVASVVLDIANVAGMQVPSLLAGGWGGMIMMGAGAAGQKYVQAKDEGASDAEALASALATGLFEGALFKLPLNAVKGLKGMPKNVVDEEVLNALKNSTLGKTLLAKAGKTAAAEGLEEGLTSIASDLADEIIYSDEIEKAGGFANWVKENGANWLYEAGIGALFGAGVGVPAGVNYYNQGTAYMANLQGLMDRIGEQTARNDAATDAVADAMKNNAQTEDTANAIQNAANALKDMNNQARNSAVQNAVQNGQQMVAEQSVQQSVQEQADVVQDTSAEPKTLIEAVDNVLNGKSVSNKFIKNIIRNQEARNIIEQKTGIDLGNTMSEGRNAINGYIQSMQEQNVQQNQPAPQPAPQAQPAQQTQQPQQDVDLGNAGTTTVNYEAIKQNPPQNPPAENTGITEYEQDLVNRILNKGFVADGDIEDIADVHPAVIDELSRITGLDIRTEEDVRALMSGKIEQVTEEVYTEQPQQRDIQVENVDGNSEPLYTNGDVGKVAEDMQEDSTAGNRDTAPSKTAPHLTRSEELSDEFKERLADDKAIWEHEVLHNKDVLDVAKQRIAEGYTSDKYLQIEPENADVFDLVTGIELLRKYDREGNYDAAINVVNKFDAINIAAGRIIQANKALDQCSPEFMITYATRKLNNIKRNLTPKQKIKYGEQLKLTAEEAELISRKMNDVQNMPDGRAKEVKMAEVMKIIEDKIPASIGKSVKAWARISMLCNPKTLITRNMGSNIGAAVVNATITDPVATLFDRLVAKKTGKRTTGASMGGYVGGIKKGTTEAVQDYKMGITTKNSGLDRWEVGNGQSFNNNTKLGKALNKADKAVSFVLDIGDRPIFSAEYAKSLENQMRINGVSEPTPEMIEVATWAGLKRTWQDQNIVTRSCNNIIRSLNEMTGNPEFGLGTLLAPFIKTPVNLAIATVEYSPVGLVKTLAIDGRNLQKAIEKGEGIELAQKKFVDGFGKASAGFLVSAVTKALFEMGLLTGGEDDDKDKANFVKNVMGIQPYSVKIGDKTYTYDWALPIGGTVGATADILKAKGTGDYAKGMATGLLQSMLTTLDVGGSFICDQTFVQTLQTVFGEDNLYDGLVKSLPNIATQMLPFGSIMGQTAGLFDDTARRTTGKDLKDLDDNKTVQAIINKMMAKTPGMTKKLEPVLDAFGREQDRYADDNFLAKVLLSYLSPGSLKKGNSGNVENEILRLYNNIGDVSLFPTIADYKITYSNQDYDFTAKEYTEYQKNYGQTAYSALSKVMASDSYKNADDNTKAEMIGLCYEYATEYSKNKYLATKGVQYDVKGWVSEIQKQQSIDFAEAVYIKQAVGKLDENAVNTYKRAKSVGIDVKKFSTVIDELNSMESDKYPDTGKTCRHSKPDRGIYTKQDKVKKYLREADMTNEERVIYWDTLYKRKNMPKEWLK